MRRKRKKSRARWALALAGAVVAPLTQAASWLVWRPSLPHPIEAPRRRIETRAGLLATYEDDSGRGVPVLLLHSLGPSGCAYELHGLFEALRGARPILAVELPGYGSSRHARVRGSESALASLVEELVAEVALRFGEKVDVVAVGNTAVAAARAVERSATNVRSLVLVSPPSTRARPRAWLRRACVAALRLPLVGAGVHRVATSRPVLELSLARRTKNLPRALVHHAWSSARQARAHVATTAALATDLVGSRELPVTKVPTLVLVGAGEVPGGVLRSPLAVPGRLVVVIDDAKALPHVERPFEAAAAMRTFWREHGRRPELRLVRGSGKAAPRVVTRPAVHRVKLRDVAPDSSAGRR